jgi:hypothetical protein
MIFQCIKLSAFAAQTLVEAKQLDMKKLDPHRTYISSEAKLLTLHYISRSEGIRGTQDDY